MVNHKAHKYTLGRLEERKPQKIDDSSNNDRVGTWKYFIKKVFSENLVKSTRKHLCQILFL